VQILYFAWLRERAGRQEEHITLPAHVTTVAQLIAWLKQRDERGAAVFAQPAAMRCAVNQEFASPDTPVGPDDEVAFFPPVTGG
jgi:molybdopterin synthase sulfur carrier subunit